MSTKELGALSVHALAWRLRVVSSDGPESELLRWIQPEHRAQVAGWAAQMTTLSEAIDRGASAISAERLLRSILECCDRNYRPQPVQRPPHWWDIKWSRPRISPLRPTEIEMALMEIAGLTPVMQSWGMPCIPAPRSYYLRAV